MIEYNNLSDHQRICLDTIRKLNESKSRVDDISITKNTGLSYTEVTYLLNQLIKSGNLTRDKQRGYTVQEEKNDNNIVLVTSKQNDVDSDSNLERTEQLSGIQQECLSAIKELTNELPAIRATDIVSKTGRSKSAISVALKHLEEQSIIAIDDNWISLVKQGEENDEQHQKYSYGELEKWISDLKTDNKQKEYLYTIAKLMETKPVVRSVDISNAMEKSKATVSVRLKKLEIQKLINIDDNGWITLNNTKETEHAVQSDQMVTVSNAVASVTTSVASVLDKINAKRNNIEIKEPNVSQDYIKSVSDTEIDFAPKITGFKESISEPEAKDDSLLTEKEKALLERTIAKLEQFYPEHKVYAFDALCSQQRENSVKMQRKLGYDTLSVFLQAYGFEMIKGEAVYELRKNCDYTPGNEPEIVKNRVDNMINRLNKYYPNHVIEHAIQRDHSNLGDTVSGLYQWLGYRSAEEMLAAYGFKYNAKAGRTATVDPVAIIDELKRRYPDGVESTVGELNEANQDLKLKSLMNRSVECFGMPLTKYLIDQGILKQHIKTEEEIKAANEAKIERARELHEKQEQLRAEKDQAELADYDHYCLKHYLGWRVLPINAEQIFKDNEEYMSKSRISNIFVRTGIDSSKHFGDLGVLAGVSTDNNLRELIQYLDFKIIETGEENK